jgi:hypothetical protein
MPHIADEPSFKLSLLVLDIYGMLIERLKGKVKPNLRAIVTSLLKHAGENKENPPDQSDQFLISETAHCNLFSTNIGT